MKGLVGRSQLTMKWRMEGVVRVALKVSVQALTFGVKKFEFMIAGIWT
jgi:hypothetical protein